MKKNIFLYGLLLFAVFAKAQLKDTICCNQFDSLGNKIGKWIEKDFFEGDSLTTISYYDNGLIEGVLTCYYPNGQVMTLQQFKGGKHEGYSKFYYKKGTINDIFIYANDVCIYHIKFLGNGEIFQETINGKVIQYKKGRPVKGK